jgi:ATP-dependent RNA helicase DDX47/RRP3
MTDPLSFEDLGLCPEACAAAQRSNWTTPTPIQARTIPQALQGADVAGMAETGSGKTGAYLLPIIHRLLSSGKPPKFAIVLAPTRELSLQICAVCEALCAGLGVLIAAAHGGADDVAQMAQLSKDPHIIVSTPGRLAQLLRDARGFRVSSAQIVAVDEADQMAGIAFYEDVRTVLAHASPQRQLLLFSATMPKDVERLAALSVSQASLIRIGARESVPSTLRELMVAVPSERKEAALCALLEEYRGAQVLVFVCACRVAEILTDTLKKLHFLAGCAHGNMPQQGRLAEMARFRTGERRILLSTNVAGRGLDLPAIDVVVNYDLPESPKEYIHRSGRTGRANRAGTAVTFVTKDDLQKYLTLEHFLKRKLEQKMIEAGLIEKWIEPVAEAKEEAVEKYKITSREREKQRARGG